MSDRERVEALAKVLAEHIESGGGLFCSCQPDDEDGGQRPLTTQWETHLAAAVLRSPAMRDLLAEAKADALRPIQNLAMEHADCSGCPTPWWLAQELAKEAGHVDL